MGLKNALDILRECPQKFWDGNFGQRLRKLLLERAFHPFIVLGG